MHIDNELYRISPAYRRLADELFRVTQMLGALAAAYGNAVNDHQRAVAEVTRLGGHWNDDPGRGGSGGDGR